MAVMTVLVTWNCSAITGLAGAIMEDDTGLIKVKHETMAVAAHLCL